MTDRTSVAARERVELLRGSLSPKARVRHGHTIGGTYTPTYHSWQAMLARCRYLERDANNKHVGRGIGVCERWRSFENFLADMGERPLGTTLDRINNDESYTPGNCRWATPREQARNRRNARLTFEIAVQVAIARLSGERAKTISERFGTSESLPREIEKGRAWPDALAEAKRRMAKMQLKSCPFCGGAPYIGSIAPAAPVRIICGGCGVEQREWFRKDQDRAIAAWNRRAHTDSTCRLKEPANGAPLQPR